MLQVNPRLSKSRSNRQADRTARLFALLADTDEARRCEILEQVVLLNAGLALSVARRYHRRGIDGDDLDQTAYLALVLAARAFDPSRGHDFASFAVPTIVGGIKRHFRDQGWAIRVPRRVQEVQLLIDRDDLPEADEVRYGAQTVGRLAERLHVSAREVELALRARGCFCPASLDEQATRQRAVRLAGDATAGEDGQEAVELRAVLRPLLVELTERDRTLLRLRFAEDLTQRSIAGELDLTQAQVSRLLTRLVERLRAAIGDGDHVSELRDAVVSSHQAP